MGGDGKMKKLAAIREQLDIKKIVTITSGQDAADNIPEMFADVGIDALQEGCQEDNLLQLSYASGDNGGGEIGPCWWMLAYSTKEYRLTDVEPPIDLGVGLTFTSLVNVPILGDFDLRYATPEKNKKLKMRRKSKKQPCVYSISLNSCKHVIEGFSILDLFCNYYLLQSLAWEERMGPGVRDGWLGLAVPAQKYNF